MFLFSSSKSYDKCDFDNVNFPFLDGITFADKWYNDMAKLVEYLRIKFKIVYE